MPLIAALLVGASLIFGAAIVKNNAPYPVEVPKDVIEPTIEETVVKKVPAPITEPVQAPQPVLISIPVPVSVPVQETVITQEELDYMKYLGDLQKEAQKEQKRLERCREQYDQYSLDILEIEQEFYEFREKALDAPVSKATGQGMVLRAAQEADAKINNILIEQQRLVISCQ